MNGSGTLLRREACKQERIRGALRNMTSPMSPHDFHPVYQVGMADQLDEAWGLPCFLSCREIVCQTTASDKPSASCTRPAPVTTS